MKCLSSYRLTGCTFFFFKILFIYSWRGERERERGRGRSRLHAGSLTWNSVLGLQDQAEGGAKPLSLPGCPTSCSLIVASTLSFSVAHISEPVLLSISDTMSITDPVVLVEVVTAGLRLGCPLS